MRTTSHFFLLCLLALVFTYISLWAALGEAALDGNLGKWLKVAVIFLCCLCYPVWVSIYTYVSIFINTYTYIYNLHTYIHTHNIYTHMHIHIHTYTIHIHIHISTVTVEWKDPAVTGPGVIFSAWSIKSLRFAITAGLRLASTTITCVGADLRGEAFLLTFCLDAASSCALKCRALQVLVRPRMSCRGGVQIAGSCTDLYVCPRNNAWACRQTQLVLHYWYHMRLFTASETSSQVTYSHTHINNHK